MEISATATTVHEPATPATQIDPPTPATQVDPLTQDPLPMPIGPPTRHGPHPQATDMETQCAISERQSQPRGDQTDRGFELAYSLPGGVAIIGNTMYIAGTKGAMDVVRDIKLPLTRRNARYRTAMEQLALNPQVKYIEGHSLGGAVAKEIAKERLDLKVVTYNAPTLPSEMPNVLAIRWQGDPVSALDSSARTVVPMETQTMSQKHSYQGLTHMGDQEWVEDVGRKKPTLHSVKHQPAVPTKGLSSLLPVPPRSSRPSMRKQIKAIAQDRARGSADPPDIPITYLAPSSVAQPSQEIVLRPPDFPPRATVETLSADPYEAAYLQDLINSYKKAERSMRIGGTTYNTDRRRFEDSADTYTEHMLKRVKTVPLQDTWAVLPIMDKPTEDALTANVAIPQADTGDIEPFMVDYDEDTVNALSAALNVHWTPAMMAFRQVLRNKRKGYLLRKYGRTHIPKRTKPYKYEPKVKKSSPKKKGPKQRVRVDPYGEVRQEDIARLAGYQQAIEDRDRSKDPIPLPWEPPSTARGSADPIPLGDVRRRRQRRM